MPSDTLYRDDIYAWSKQQAEALRELQRRAPSNGVDWANVIEEIEDVGGNVLKAVRSALKQLFIHLIKAASAPGAGSVPHWSGEIVEFQDQAADDFTASMRHNLDLDEVWRKARKIAVARLAEADLPIGEGVPTRCPFTLDQLLADDFDVNAAVARLRPSSDPERG
jgi:hypothetical protein